MRHIELVPTKQDFVATFLGKIHIVLSRMFVYQKCSRPRISFHSNIMEKIPQQMAYVCEWIFTNFSIVASFD